MTKHESRPTTLSLMHRLIKTYLRRYLRELWMAVFFMLLASAMTAIFAMMMEPVMDRVMVDGQRGLILPLGFTVFLCFLITGVAGYMHHILMNRIGQGIVSDVQKDLFARFMSLDVAFFQHNPSGQLLSRVVNDVSMMRTAVADCLTGMGRSFVTLILLVGVMVYQDWKLTLICLTVFPVAGYIVIRIGRRLRKISANIQREVANLSSYLSQVFQGIRQVKAFNMENAEIARAGTVITSVRELIMKSARISTVSVPVNEVLVGVAVFAMIVYGGYQVADGKASVGGLISFITAFGLAFEPMRRLAKLNNTLQMGLGCAERVFEMIDRQPEIVSRPDAKVLDSRNPDIKLENVSFSYQNSDGPALNAVTLAIPAGRVTALVGPSGGGKTTIMNLIPRFYDVGEGRITVDGMDIRDLTLDSLRGAMAMVSQDITIFDDTVRANIAYGRADATDEEIMVAARAAEADGFINALPDGYDTRLGEDGTRLSGGQRQRIAIARAILRDAPILLLDEATSALDNESEQAIQKTLAGLQKGRTTLVIAHRLSTVQNADQIVVLDRGRIVEQGRHDDLMALNGLYARMYQMGLRE